MSCKEGKIEEVTGREWRERMCSGQVHRCGEMGASEAEWKWKTEHQSLREHGDKVKMLGAVRGMSERSGAYKREAKVGRRGNIEPCPSFRVPSFLLNM